MGDFNKFVYWIISHKSAFSLMAGDGSVDDNESMC